MMNSPDSSQNIQPSLRPQIRTICGLLLGLLTTTCTPSQTPSKTSAEEIQIRTAYARLSFGTEVAIINKLAHDNATPSGVAESIAKNVVHFKIDSIKVGDIPEILDDSYRDLVTFPEDTGLETGYLGNNHNTSGKETTEGGNYAKWVKVERPNFDTSVPFSRILQAAQGQGIAQGAKRYAKVAVTASLDGQERSYNALWLFLDNAKPISIIDPSSGSAIMTIASQSVYPHVLLETGLRFNRVVQGWLASRTVDAPSCAASGASECCDTDMMQCGISRKDIEQSLQKANDPREKMVAPAYHPPSLASGSTERSLELPFP